MSSERYGQFRNEIHPFLDLWQSGEVACIAVNQSGNDISLGTRVVLRPEPIATHRVAFSLEKELSNTRLVAACVKYSRETVMQLLNLMDAKEGFDLDVGRYVYQIHLCGAQVGSTENKEVPLHWTRVGSESKAEAKNHYGVERPCKVLVGCAGPTYQLVTSKLADEINISLQAHVPPIDGLDELFSKLLPGVKFAIDVNTRVQVVAPLPFEFAYDPTVGFTVRAPRTAFDRGMKMVLFLRPDGERFSWPLEAKDLTEIDGASTPEWRYPFEWPRGAATGKAILLYTDQKVDELTVNRPSASTLDTPERMTRTILFLASNPTDTGRLRLDKELREIEEGLKRSKERDQFTLVSKFAVRVDDLRRSLLDHSPRIVHFAGHGEGADGILVENDQGQAFQVATDALARLFELCAGHIECVVLNACYSDVQANAIAQYIP
jgi:hypothetical protein